MSVLLGIGALAFACGLIGFAFEAVRQDGEWRTMDLWVVLLIIGGVLIVSHDAPGGRGLPPSAQEKSNG